jgi:hypothetical protein
MTIHIMSIFDSPHKYITIHDKLQKIILMIHFLKWIFLFQNINYVLNFRFEYYQFMFVI